MGHRAIPRLVAILAVLAAGTCWVGSVRSAGTETQANSSIAAAGQLARGGSESHPLPIDVATRCMFLLLTTAGDVELVMTSPSGKRWSSHHPGNESEGGHFSADPTGFVPGGMSTVSIESPEPGAWSAKVIAHSMPDSVTSIAYVLKVLQNTGEHGPVLHSLVPARTYHRGESLLVRVSLLEAGQPVPNARLEAAAGFADGEGGELALRDDGVAPDSLGGDGIHTGAIPPLAQDGLYELVVAASRETSPGAPAFRRTISQTLRVSRTASRLNGRYSDFLRDSNRDGLPDELVIGIGVRVTGPDSIGMVAWLSGAKGPVQWGRIETRLVPAGEQTLELAYSLEDLRRNCGPGAFQLDSLMLFEENDPYGLLFVLDDPRHLLHRTRSYSADELISDPIHPTGEATVEGVDENGDGKFDLLAVDMPIVMRLAGRYAWHVLLERDRSIVAQGSGVWRLPAGRSSMRFLFPGSCLAHAPQGGRYVLADLSMNFVPEGPRPVDVPRALHDVPGILLEGVPPPGRFDPLDPGSPRPRRANDPASYDSFHCN